MPALITNRFRVHNAKQFIESFSEAALSRYYVFIGRVTSFADDNAPPTPTDMVQNVEYDYYRDMIAMKRIQSSDASHSIPRYNWANNTAYSEYNNRSTSLWPTTINPASNTTFYVVNSDFNVYKCIDNNRGGRSTIKPTGTLTSIITTADGYRWKFLYNISAAEQLKFLTTNYIPVKTLTANDGSSQWAVQQAASNGSIDHYNITANGSGYLSTTNVFAAVVNSTVVSLGDNASGTDNIYNYSTIFISDGLGAGQLRRILRYTGSSRTAVVNTAFTTSPNTSSRYVVGPNVIINGDSGATSAVRASAYVSNCAGGSIRKITPISTGLNYSTANVTITANSSWGSGATVLPIISPPGGHGANPIDELYGKNIMLNVKLTGTESNTFPANNEFRVIGILRDPLLRSGPAANVSVIDQCTRITVTGLNGDLTADEIITGSTSGAKSRFVRFANTNAAMTAGLVRVINHTKTGTGGSYVPGETVTGSVSGKTAIVAAITPPAVREYTGDILYIENRTPITRASNQIEDIKMLIRF